LDQILAKTAQFLGCDLDGFKKAARVSSRRVLDRDLLLYAVWQLGVRTNSELGAIFGMTGSAVSKRMAMLKCKAADNELIRERLTVIKAIIEI
jgi:hypothetical protein